MTPKARRASMLTPTDVGAKAQAALRSRLRRWLIDVDEAARDRLTVPLHPPTEQVVARDPDAARDWVRGWHRYAGSGQVEWQPRRWPSFGTQQVPFRIGFAGADEIATAAGQLRRWRTLLSRRHRLVALAPQSPLLPEAVAGGVNRWEPFSETDFDRLVVTVGWLLAHPDSGMFIRQLPIEGVDTKWLGGNRGLVERLVGAVRGDTELGVRTLPALVEIALLDPELLPGMPRLFAASIADLAGLPIAPATVLVLENKEGVYALPAAPEMVAVHGRGYGVIELASLPWLSGTDVVYWGDLDSHGLTILDRFRSRLAGVRSVMMDTDTLTRWEHLAVPEPTLATGETPHLEAAEQAALTAVLDRGIRLEQERIPWPHAVAALRAAGLPLR